LLGTGHCYDKCLVKVIEISIMNHGSARNLAKFACLSGV
jgi:hypothetical protein